MIGLIDEQDKALYLKRLPNDIGLILKELEPFQEQLEGLVVEYADNRYWLVDGPQDAG